MTLLALCFALLLLHTLTQRHGCTRHSRAVQSDFSRHVLPLCLFRARKELKDQISAGELVADDVVIELVKVFG